MQRRHFLHCSACASAAALVGCADPEPLPILDAGAGPDVPPFDAGVDTSTAEPDSGPDAGPQCDDAFAGGTLLGVVPFVGNERTLEVRLGQGWDGRLYTDLSSVPEEPVVSNERFYIRTLDPDRLDRAAAWRIEVGGLADAASLTLDDVLVTGVRDMGLHVLECSGNGGPSFGLMSAARWGGVPVMEVLDSLSIDPAATAVEVRGFDDHSVPSAGGHSTPGAAWIFTFDQLAAAGAFFATEMNGMPLPNDHGSPLRLYVPGWYGCACIKWVNSLRFVDDTEPATDQMREFAGRTHQPREATLAADFLPAIMDQSAMPVRVEKWRVDGEIVYRVYGILWGGSTPTDELILGWGGPNQQRVETCPPQTMNAMWTVWQTAWRPASTGEFSLRMRIEDDAIPTNRLDTGYYARSVDVDEI
ncbi:MAG: molybdopterin-dependent oxidoreductase [Polyangiales bacterium]